MPTKKANIKPSFTDNKYYRKQATIRFLQAKEEVCKAETAKNFAQVVGMGANNIDRLKVSESNFVTIDAICKLCLHYNYSYAWIMAGIGPTKNYNQQAGMIALADEGIAIIENAMKQVNQAITDYKKVTKRRK